MTLSTANGQRCLNCGATYPLYPPLVTGCSSCAASDFKAPVEVTYDYPSKPTWLPDHPLPGLGRYGAMLPPLADRLSMGEGGTPLVEHIIEDLDGVEIYVKDESRNPTWSHKDRLNLAVISAAIAMKCRGIVVASSGNHGASAAAYSSRAGLKSIILTTPRPPAVASFMQAYGQTVIAVPNTQTRFTLMARLVDEFSFHPGSNQTLPPTNHPFGSESYKTIAYEIYLQLGRRSPEAVFVPTGYAELLFGIYKGFGELMYYELIEDMPRMIACEPAAGAPLKRALEKGTPLAHVETSSTGAYAIAVPVNSYRGVVAVQKSLGAAVAIAEHEIIAAQKRLSHAGMWVEQSSAISFAGLLRARELGLGQRGPLIAISTSSGFKDLSVGNDPILLSNGSWEELLDILGETGVNQE